MLAVPKKKIQLNNEKMQMPVKKKKFRWEIRFFFKSEYAIKKHKSLFDTKFQNHHNINL